MLTFNQTRDKIKLKDIKTNKNTEHPDDTIVTILTELYWAYVEKVFQNHFSMFALDEIDNTLD